ncbi:MAG: bifunctional 2-polyprenyl-6-hydroxyphenol methylase/3-demethylubiquinol 3-O-methyltransferase UbiG [Chloroflexota bacterium]|nr:bifunctional 2-polyprenyl-6-hydroxyphenol methylase/3-demethylubiquinol 3-O-methyltransferase UbiG [Chloroflexota bacterium]
MPIDNDLYERLGSTWWDENEPLNMLRSCMNPGRFGYFREVFLTQLKIDPQGKEALDIGCGGGLLAEEFAHLGCHVTGIDPSEASLATARTHAQQEGLSIDYRVGVGETLPFADEAFDLVYCSDVLEHVKDLNAVTSEVARVLKTGGVFFYDTINRTFMSKLITIQLLQEWKATRVMPANLHDWHMFITPSELRTLMKRHQLVSQEITGLGPHANPLTLINSLRKWKQGKLSLRELGTRLNMGQSRDMSNSYMGYAIKSSGPGTI